MDERSVCLGMTEADIAALKEALHSQQKLLQKLYIELEEEREASATAASEALSMILRLQGEKAAEKMEASQYKRMAEEKMYHAEEYIAVFEDLMYQKDMEIASLECQVQASKHKLLSMGFCDPSIGEMRFPEKQFLQRNEAHFGDMGVNGTVRRNNSLPAIRFKELYSKNGHIEREGSAILLGELIPREIDEDPDCEFVARSGEIQKSYEEYAVGDFNSYWEQIQQLDEQVKELSLGKGIDRGIDSDRVSSKIAAYFPKLKNGSGSCSLHSSASRDPSYDRTRESIGIRLGTEGTLPSSSSQAEDPKSLSEFDASLTQCSESKAITPAVHFPTVHDIFEVPQNHEKHKLCGLCKQEGKKLISEGESRLGKPDSFLQGTAEYYCKDEDDCEKKVLLCAHQEATKLSKPKDRVAVDCHLALLAPTIGVSLPQAEVQRFNKRLELLEGDRRNMKQEAYTSREEELKLLREIHEQLNMIQSKMNISNANKCSPPDDSSLVPLMEAMLHFWL